LSLAFEAQGSPFSAAFELVFEEIARAQVAAFVARAAKVYG
jgi:ribosome-associated toxin RatA of RatAB toxin-antitoxin module